MHINSQLSQIIFNCTKTEGKVYCFYIDFSWISKVTTTLWSVYDSNSESSLSSHQYHTQTRWVKRPVKGTRLIFRVMNPARDDFLLDTVTLKCWTAVVRADQVRTTAQMDSSSARDTWDRHNNHGLLIQVRSDLRIPAVDAGPSAGCEYIQTHQTSTSTSHTGESSNLQVQCAVHSKLFTGIRNQWLRLFLHQLKQVFPFTSNPWSSTGNSLLQSRCSLDVCFRTIMSNKSMHCCWWKSQERHHGVSHNQTSLWH